MIVGIRGKKTAVGVAHISKKVSVLLKDFWGFVHSLLPLLYISISEMQSLESLLGLYHWIWLQCSIEQQIHVQKSIFLIWQLWPQISTLSQGCITDLYANCWPPPVGHSQTDSNTSTGHWKQHMETFYRKILNKSSRETGHGILWPSFLLILQ